VFDPTGALASTYYNNVILALTGTMALQADFTQDDTLQDWLPDYINTFIQNYYTGKTRPTDPGADQTAFDIGYDLDQAVVNFGGLAGLVQQIIAQGKQVVGQDLMVQATTIAGALSGKIGMSVFSVLLAAGIVATILALTNWDSLPPDQQAATVANVAAVIYTVGQVVPDIINATEWATAAFAATLRPAMATAGVMTEMSELLPRPQLTTGFFGWLATKFDSATKSINYAGTRVAALFATKGYQIFMNGVSALLAAAAFAISIWTFVSDAKTGADGVNLAFDSAQSVLSAIVLVCSAMALIPLVDVVVMIIGVAAALVAFVLALAQSLYNWINPQTTLAENYIKYVVQPLIATLNPAPAGWSPPQTN
jgi:hypothetical protein